MLVMRAKGLPTVYHSNIEIKSRFYFYAFYVWVPGDHDQSLVQDYFPDVRDAFWIDHYVDNCWGGRRTAA
jgi:hypothetical protein